MVAVFCHRLIDGRPLDFDGDGEQKRDPVYAEGMATANGIAADIPLGADAGLNARAFKAGTGEAMSGNRLATLLEEIAGARPGRVCEDARAGELRRSVPSAARIRAMGWSPAHPLRDGLARTFRHIASEKAVSGTA